MKKSAFSIFCLSLCVILLLAACSKTAATATPAAEVQTETQPPVETPTPTEEEPAEPVACDIVYESDVDGNLEIYKMAPDGSNQVNLTNDNASDSEPAFSPDGSQIAFVSNRLIDGQDNGLFLYVMNADGSNVRKLTQENGARHPDWSADGKVIVYSNSNDIFMIKADGSGEPLQLTDTPENDINPVYSPVKEEIAWLSGPENALNIFVMDLNTKEIKQITNDGKVSDIQYSVDGRIFANWDNQEVKCFNCILNSDGTNVIDAGGKGAVQEFLPFWTADGQRVECVSVNIDDTDEEIYLVGEIFENMFLNLTNNDAEDRKPDWPANCGPTGETTSAPAESAQTEPTLQPGEIVIGYTGERDAQQESDLLQACSELGVQCVEGTDLIALADQNVNAIVYFSNRWNTLGDSPKIHDVALRMIPLVVLNAESEETYNSDVVNLSVDSDATKKTLQYMFDGMGGSGEFAYSVVGGNEFHQKVINWVLEDYPGITATSIKAEFDGVALADANITQLFVDNPNLKAMWADEYARNLFWGVSSLESTPLPFVPCESRDDIFSTWKDSLDTEKSWHCISTIQPGGTGYEGFYVAFYLASGEQIDPAALGGIYRNTLIYDYPFITNENLSEWMDKSDSFRLNEWGGYTIPPMTPEEIKEKWFLE